MQQDKLQDTVTEDYLLGHKLKIRQPRHGYRVAIDPIFLASAIRVQPGEIVLDIGSGVGAAALCLATRVRDCRIIGLEIQRDYARLAAENIIANNLRHRAEVLMGDLLRPPPRLAAGTYAHIMANPPYLELTSAKPSNNFGKALSNIESEASLEQWARFCLLMVRPKGTLTFIHRPERLEYILSYFAGKLGEIVIFPLWTARDKPAKRVLIQGRKGSHAPLRLSPGLVLHQPNGNYTPEAEAILRDGVGLML